MIGNEQQTDWDVLLPHMPSAYDKSVNAATGLAPIEIHMDRLPRLSLSVFEADNIGGHHGLDRDHLVYINLATHRQRRAYSFVRELHRLTVSPLQRHKAKTKQHHLYDRCHHYYWAKLTHDTNVEVW